MEQIVLLRNRHALKNNLISNIAYRDRQLSALPQGEETKKKRLDLLMPKKLILDFLDSDKLSSLTPEEVNQLNDLFQIAQEKHVLLENLHSHVDNAPTGYTSKITADDLTQANAAFQKADDAIIAKIKELLSVPQPPIPAAAPFSPKAAAATPLLEEEDKLSMPSYPPPPIPTASSSASAAPSLPPSRQELNSLEAFAQKLHDSLLSQAAPSTGNVSSAATASTKIEKSIQTGNLAKLLKLLADQNPPAEKIKSLRPLVDLMKKIEEKEKEIDTVSKTNTLILEQEIAALENQFMAGLEASKT